MKKFTQEQPASRFGEAYPVGNGHMGAVIYGSFPVEKIILTDNTFFSGKRSRHNVQKGADKAFWEMRSLINKGDYTGAHEAAKRFHGVRGDYGTSLPAGEVEITFSGEKGLCKRSLDIENGLAEAFFKNGEECIKTRCFASHPDRLLVWHMESRQKQKLTVRFLPYHGNGSLTAVKDGFRYQAHALETVHCDTPCGTMLYGRCKAISDGILRMKKDGIVIENAGNLSLYFMEQTDYKILMEYPDEEEVPAERYRRFTEKIMDGQEKKAGLLTFESYEKIMKAHINDVNSLMNRVSVSLQGRTPEETEQAEKAAQLFQYGRYLLLSSSREDSVLPAQLQGIWNDDVACRIGWTCDMHLDINTQMNYWPADVTALPETLPPLFRYLERLAEEGKQNAEISYGMKGWAAEIVSNAWCYQAPYWAVPISPYPTGGAWLLTHVWEHYAYSHDKTCLERLFPVMEGAVRFFTEYVFEESNGNLSSGPSVSAENSFLIGDKICQISNGCTYELTVIREVFEQYLKACRVLKKDGELAEKAAELLRKFPKLRVLEDGTLAEWSHDYPPADPQHRHTSHLIGLFPFAGITPEETPLLAEAAERSIEAKLTPYEQWEDTGWARSLLILYEARLHHGEKAWFHVKSMMEKLQEPNSMIYHPPTRGTLLDDDFGHVYELDGNTGLTSGIAEMLIQSHNKTVRLLPAVPSQWESGSVKGLQARGGIRADFSWEKGKITEIILTAGEDCRAEVVFGTKKCTLSLRKNTPYRLGKSLC